MVLTAKKTQQTKIEVPLFPPRLLLLLPFETPTADAERENDERKMAARERDKTAEETSTSRPSLLLPFQSL